MAVLYKWGINRGDTLTITVSISYIFSTMWHNQVLCEILNILIDAILKKPEISKRKKIRFSKIFGEILTKIKKPL